MPAEDDSPSARARRGGARIEVADQTTPTRKVFANPDGTYTAELHVTPVRVRRAGRWVPIDTTLRVGADGRVAPVASASAVSFSGGGSTPLVMLADGSRKLDLGWSGRLPRPVLHGSTATYRDVLPGVDLRLTAREQGFAKVFVVKDREAAARVAALPLTVRTAGLRLRADGGQNLEGFDASGELVLHGARPQLWDSSATASGEARRSQGGIELAGGRLTVHPDQAFLSDPNTTYPVYIDPDFSPAKIGWTSVFKEFPTTSYWNGDGLGEDRRARVGFSNWERPYTPDVTVRSYFQYDIDNLYGKTILAAEFNALESWSPSCQDRTVELWYTGTINSSTTWNSRPSGVMELDARYVAHGYSSSCPSAWVGFNAKNAVVNAAASRHHVTLMLMARDETDPYAWKKFENNPKLIVTYNTQPSKPTSLTVAGRTCDTAPSQPYITDSTPTLKARLSDPDGDSVKAEFEWYVRGGAKLGEVTTTTQQSGAYFSVNVPSGAYGNGSKITWRVHGYDGREWGPWSDWCHADVDQTKPTAPTIGSTDYPADVMSGGIGRTGVFTLNANGVSDVVAFKYGLDKPQPQTKVTAVNGTASVKLTPPIDGPMDVYALSVDRAGNEGPTVRYHIVVGAGTPPTGLWRLDGYDRLTAAPDSSGRGHDGTVNAMFPGAGAAWTTGRVDDAVKFTGSGYVTTAGGLTTHTNSTFTVAAWVRVDGGSGSRTAVMESSSRVAAFALGVDGSTGTWSFSMPASDSDTATLHSARSSIKPVTGAWTHLTGSYDVASGTIRLYVNGRWAASGSHTTKWDAVGTLQIGRGKRNGVAADYFVGAIDEVRVWDRLLATSPANHEIAALANLPAVDEGFYPLDGDAVDVSGHHRNGTLGSGATWTAGVKGSGAVAFDGTTGGYVDTGATAVRTDRSFTVAAWGLATGSGRQTLVSQTATRSSGWRLQFKPGTEPGTGTWVFQLSPADADAPAWQTVEATELSYAGEWTHVAAVYDMATRELRIYLNGAISGSFSIPPEVAIGNLAGTLQLGRAKASQSWMYPLTGAVDEVRVFTGALTADQLRNEVYENPELTRTTAYDGQFSRWVNHTGDHLASTGAVPPGYRFEGSLGVPAPAGAADTRMLYACRIGTDHFTSKESNCEGQRVLAPLGLVYVSPPVDVPSIPIMRCKVTGTGEHFLSKQTDCEGQTVEATLGYAQAYGVLVRYVRKDLPGHLSSVHQTSPAYRVQSGLGFTALFAPAGTTTLRTCADAAGRYFSSVQPDCEGGSLVAYNGNIWTSPPADLPSAELYRCVDAAGNRFDSTDPWCDGDGNQLQVTLGYLATGLVSEGA
ncbi:MAG: LamG domain-containing protein [Micromonosporaceae bacterium]